MFRELTKNEVLDLIEQGYGYFSFLGGFEGKRKDAVIIGAGDKDYFVDDRDCEEYRQLLLEQNKEAKDYQEYLGEIGYGN